MDSTCKIIQYTQSVYISAGEPMARVPKVASETIFRGTRGEP